MKTDDEIRAIMDSACNGGDGQKSTGDLLREFAEEVIAMRQRIAELERLVADLVKP